MIQTKEYYLKQIKKLYPTQKTITKEDYKKLVSTQNLNDLRNIIHNQLCHEIVSYYVSNDLDERSFKDNIFNAFLFVDEAIKQLKENMPAQYQTLYGRVKKIVSEKMLKQNNDFLEKNIDLNFKKIVSSEKIEDNGPIYDIEMAAILKSNSQVLKDYILKTYKYLNRLKGISNRNVEILKDYFGFNGKELNVYQLAEKYNMSHQNVSLIIKSALKNMRSHRPLKSFANIYHLEAIEAKQKHNVQLTKREEKVYLPYESYNIAKQEFHKKCGRNAIEDYEK